jgi:hypothetical protein
LATAAAAAAPLSTLRYRYLRVSYRCVMFVMFVFMVAFGKVILEIIARVEKASALFCFEFSCLSNDFVIVTVISVLV